MNSKNAKPLEDLKGSVERVTFHNEDNGFCVLRANVKNQRDLITVIGKTPSIGAGEYIECTGYWINDKTHGLQFQAETIKVIPPTTVEGIEKYLASGMVKGIGPHFAQKLIKRFGKDVLDIIELQPNLLLSVDGIGKKRVDLITSAWDEQKAIREIMIFLQSYGVGSGRAVRIYKAYGNDAIALVSQNPYRLSLDIKGIGFKIADAIAERLGIEKNSLIRAQAGIRHVLHELCDEGHCAVAKETLGEKSHTLLEIPLSVIEEAIYNEIGAGNVVEDIINDVLCIYPLSLHKAEINAAFHLKRLQKGFIPWKEIDMEKALPWVEKKTGIKLSSSQQAALKCIIKAKVSIITGGPGVGKTTLIKSFLQIITAKKLNIALCAPTGRAAKRLTETSGLMAKTIHRLLEFNPKNFSFTYDQNNQLDLDVLIIDETSMLDIALLYHLVKAIPSHAAVLFVGDIDQLPSVGSGAILADLIKSEVITTVKLTEIFRQAAHSRIITNAHRVNSGSMPLPNSPHADSDFFTIYFDTAEKIHDELVHIVSVRLPQFYKCDPLKDIQVLTPMNRASLGTRSLNQSLQERLNINPPQKITRFGTTFAPKDKVIQMRNNYEKEVFNGDIGFIEEIEPVNGIIKINFEGKIKDYETYELDELSLAYAISIHKSQGSEFPIVVMPLATQHFTLLARNLLYTGITRGKKLVVLVGQKKAIGMAVHNNKEANRLTNLAQRLRV